PRLLGAGILRPPLVDDLLLLREEALPVAGLAVRQPELVGQVVGGDEVGPSAAGGEPVLPAPLLPLVAGVVVHVAREGDRDRAPLRADDVPLEERQVPEGVRI